MAGFDYDAMQARAGALLERFNQGASSEQVITTTPAPNAWDLPTETVAETVLDAVARGVSSKYVDGVNILATDLQMTISAVDFTATAGMAIKIDGSAVTVLRVDAIPAMGTAVAWRVFVRR